MDNNTTALNTIKQEVNNVKGSVVEMNKVISNIRKIDGREVARDVNNDEKRIENKVTLFSITGKGKLIGLRFYFHANDNYGGTLTISKDGVVYNIKSTGNMYSSDFCLMFKEYALPCSNGFRLSMEDIYINVSDDAWQAITIPSYMRSVKNEYILCNYIDFASSLEISYTPNKSNYYKRLELKTFCILE